MVWVDRRVHFGGGTRTWGGQCHYLTSLLHDAMTYREKAVQDEVGVDVRPLRDGQVQGSIFVPLAILIQVIDNAQQAPEQQEEHRVPG